MPVSCPTIRSESSFPAQLGWCLLIGEERGIPGVATKVTRGLSYQVPFVSDLRQLSAKRWSGLSAVDIDKVLQQKFTPINLVLQHQIFLGFMNAMFR